MSRGVLYIAMGEDFVKEAECSAKSCKREMQDVPIALITDQDFESAHFDEIIVVDESDRSFGDVVRFIGDTPFEKTLYLDSDIYVNSDISEVFSLLDEFDIAASPERSSWHKDHYGLNHPIKGVPEGFPWYNGGVIGFTDTEEVQEFLSLWMSEYENDLKEGIVHNMISLRHALYFSDVRIATLPRRYNCLFRNLDHVVGTVKVFHGRLLNIESPGAPQLYDVDDAIRELNSSEKSRVYVPMRDDSIEDYSFEVIDSKPRKITVYYSWPPIRITVYDSSPNLLYRTLLSLQQDGVLETGIKGWKKLLRGFQIYS